MAEGFSTITYQNKTILYFDFSVLGKSKEKTLQLINSVGVEYQKYTLNSVLALFNCTDLYFDMDVLNNFKEVRTNYCKYEKKVAGIGITGLLKTGYNFVVGLTNRDSPVKIFDSEIEAKKWLIGE